MGDASVKAGSSAPLGATVHADGVNFSVFSKNATQVDLLLFDDGDAARPSRVIALDPTQHRTYHYWHVFVPGIGPGQIYAYRAHGPFAPEQGFRFDGDKVLLDPYGLARRGPRCLRPRSRRAARRQRRHRDEERRRRSECLRLGGRSAAPRARSTETIIYELHVRGLTQHPSSGVDAKKRGTYAGLIEKIPYLKDLGITAVELLPVFQFDFQDAPPGVELLGLPADLVLCAAPRVTARGASRSRSSTNSATWSRRCTARASRSSSTSCTTTRPKARPTDRRSCYRGLANDVYYILEADESRYADFTAAATR